MVTKVIPFVLVGKRRFSLVFECLDLVGNLLTSVSGAVLFGVVGAPKIEDGQSVRYHVRTGTYNSYQRGDHYVTVFKFGVCQHPRCTCFPG